MTVFEGLRELYDYRELLWTWTLRSIKARYKQTLLGATWAIAQPLAITVERAVYEHLMPAIYLHLVFRESPRSRATVRTPEQIGGATDASFKQ